MSENIELSEFISTSDDKRVYEHPSVSFSKSRIQLNGMQQQNLPKQICMNI